MSDLINVYRRLVDKADFKVQAQIAFATVYRDFSEYLENEQSKEKNDDKSHEEYFKEFCEKNKHNFEVYLVPAEEYFKSRSRDHFSVFSKDIKNSTSFKWQYGTGVLSSLTSAFLSVAIISLCIVFLNKNTGNTEIGGLQNFCKNIEEQFTSK